MRHPEQCREQRDALNRPCIYQLPTASSLGKAESKILALFSCRRNCFFPPWDSLPPPTEMRKKTHSPNSLEGSGSAIPFLLKSLLLDHSNEASCFNFFLPTHCTLHWFFLTSLPSYLEPSLVFVYGYIGNCCYTAANLQQSFKQQWQLYKTNWNPKPIALRCLIPMPAYSEELQDAYFGWCLAPSQETCLQEIRPSSRRHQVPRFRHQVPRFFQIKIMCWIWMWFPPLWSSQGF